MLRHTCMCLFSKCCNCFKNKLIYTHNITHSREIITPIILDNTNNTNNIHIINNDSDNDSDSIYTQESNTKSITESLPESIADYLDESINERIQQNIIIFNNNIIIKDDDIRIPELINDIPIHTNTHINTHINTPYIEHKDDNDNNNNNNNNNNKK